jgi:hypothetical protein
LDLAVELARQLAEAFLKAAGQPFYYIGILFVILLYRRQIALERRLFATRLHSLAGVAVRTVLAGMIAGAAVSFAMAFVGATVPFGAVLWLWGVSIILALVKVRFICIAYSAGLLGLLHALVAAFPRALDWPVAGTLLKPLAELPVSSMLALVGLLHLLEAFFVQWQGAQMAMPMFIEGKRGKIVGAYQLQQYWPVPLVLLVPAQTSAAALPWTPLFGGDIWASGWSFAAMPVLLGFAERTVTQLPQQKAQRSARRLFAYSAILLILAALAEWLPAFVWIGAAGSILLHEALVLWSNLEEKGAPLYVHDKFGLKILGVLPKSPAEEMGLLPGERIHKANGAKVRTKEELHYALQSNAAFCRLEVIDREGHNRFVQKALFTGDHHLLGVILAPDDKVVYYLEEQNIHWLTKAVSRLSAKPETKDADRSL